MTPAGDVSNVDASGDQIAEMLRNSMSDSKPILESDFYKQPTPDPTVVIPPAGSPDPTQTPNPPVTDPAAAAPATPAADPAKSVDPAVAPAADPAAPAAEKPWYEQDEPAPAGTPAAASAPGAQPAQDDQMAKYAKVINNPEVKFMLDQVLAGKSIYDVQKELTIVDYDNMSPSALYEHDLRASGATPEQIAKALDEFKDLELYKQNQEVRSLRPFYKNQQAQKMAQVSQTAQQAQATEAAKAQRVQQELSAYVQKIKGTKMFDYEVTDAVLDRALQTIYGGFKELNNPDGTPNIEKCMRAAILINDSPGIVRANVRNAVSQGRGEVNREVANGSKNYQGSSAGMNRSQTIEETVKLMEERDKQQQN